MLKIILGAGILLIVLIGGSAVALFYFMGWKGLLIFPFIIIAIFQLIKPVARLFFNGLNLSLLSPKSDVLQESTMTVLSLVPVPAPLPEDGDSSPAEVRHYYDVEVTITPRESESQAVWEPAKLALISQRVTSVSDLHNKEVGYADEVQVWNRAKFEPDVGEYTGEQRLKITFAVTPGNSRAWLHYYNQTIAALELPPWNCQGQPQRARQTERTERSRREASVKSPEQLVLAKAARRRDQFKTGAGKPETEIKLYEPPSNEHEEKIDLDLTMDEVDAALDRADARRMERDPIGGSRFGGVPDLPPSLPWPALKGRKLPFLAQIDLSMLPKSALPSDGWLYVFVLSDNEHDPTPVQVFHHSGPREELVRAPRPAKKQVWEDWTGNRIYSVVPLKATEEEGWSGCGSLFGEIDEDGEDAASVADGQDCSGDDWITLMTIPSVGSMMWSDCGLFQIAIRRSDLANNDFSKVCGSICCAG